jgi:hypothetical protein
MTQETAVECIRALERTTIRVDTGGAPELNPNFRWLVAEAAAWKTCDRPVQPDGPAPGPGRSGGVSAFHRVEVICSLPCFQERETDRQRGEACFSVPSGTEGLMHWLWHA